MKLGIAVALVALVLIPNSSLRAHHSQGTFYFLDRSVEITGVVTDLRLVNPHSFMQVEVGVADGEKEVWTVYGGNRQQMSNEAGWEVGRSITAVGCPARNPAARGMYMGAQCPASLLTLISEE